MFDDREDRALGLCRDTRGLFEKESHVAIPAVRAHARRHRLRIVAGVSYARRRGSRLRVTWPTSACCRRVGEKHLDRRLPETAEHRAEVKAGNEEVISQRA
jgi:hypothetical protein